MATDPHTGAREALGAHRRPGRRLRARWILSWAAIAVPLAVVAGVVVHLVDTAPEPLSAVPALLRMAMAVVLVLAILLGAMRALMMDDPRLAVAIPVFAMAAGIAYPLAPTWVPGATVAGTYTLRLGDGSEPISGPLTCEWRPGRYRMGAFAAAEPAVLPGGERVEVHASFTLPAVWLDRSAADGTPRAPYVDPRGTVLSPPRAENLEPQRSIDGRLGRTQLRLTMDTSRPPSGAAATWASRLAGDPGTGRAAVLAWSCDLP